MIKNHSRSVLKIGLWGTLCCETQNQVMSQAVDKLKRVPNCTQDFFTRILHDMLLNETAKITRTKVAIFNLYQKITVWHFCEFKLLLINSYLNQSSLNQHGKSSIVELLLRSFTFAKKVFKIGQAVIFHQVLLFQNSTVKLV